jgi:hypothetical protein
VLLVQRGADRDRAVAALRQWGSDTNLDVTSEGGWVQAPLKSAKLAMVSHSSSLGSEPPFLH